MSEKHRIVGIAERGLDAGWNYVCNQIDLKLSDLTIREGYYHSKDDCLLCDVMSHSFLIETKLFQRLNPDMNLDPKVRALDFGLQLKKAGIQGATCPESMYHTYRPVIYPVRDEPIFDKDQYLALKKDYLSIAKKWILSSIRPDKYTLLEYTCKEIDFSCNPMKVVKHYNVPRCMLKDKEKMLKIFATFAKKYSIPFSLHAGCSLASVKFRGPFPWDVDGDYVYPRHMYHYIAKHSQTLLAQGFDTMYPAIIGDNYKVAAHYPGGYMIDIFGYKGTTPNLHLLTSDNDLPKNIPCLMNSTKLVLVGDSIQDCYYQSLVRYGPHWVPTVFNPVTHAIFMYGDRIFKHKAHQRYYKANEVWPKCPKKEDPLCLDKYPNDGNIPFQNY